MRPSRAPEEALRLIRDAEFTGYVVHLHAGSGWVQVYVRIPGHMTWARWESASSAGALAFVLARTPVEAGTDDEGYTRDLEEYRQLLRLDSAPELEEPLR